MVATKTASRWPTTGGGQPEPSGTAPDADDAADTQAGSLPALEQGDPLDVAGRGVAAGKKSAGRDGKAPTREATTPEAPRALLFEEVLVDSSPERERAPAKRGCSISSSSSSSSRGRRRSRSGKGKRRKNRSSSSSASSKPRKKRINNFSSIRNVEKEKAKQRLQRTQGAMAAVKVLQVNQPLAAGPYFAP